MIMTVIVIPACLCERSATAPTCGNKDCVDNCSHNNLCGCVLAPIHRLCCLQAVAEESPTYAFRLPPPCPPQAPTTGNLHYIVGSKKALLTFESATSSVPKDGTQTRSSLQS